MRGSRFFLIEEQKSEGFLINKIYITKAKLEYSVIDTKEGKETYGDYWKKRMCETFDKDEAVMICYALNQHFH